MIKFFGQQIVWIDITHMRLVWFWQTYCGPCLCHSWCASFEFNVWDGLESQCSASMFLNCYNAAKLMRAGRPWRQQCNRLTNPRRLRGLFALHWVIDIVIANWWWYWSVRFLPMVMTCRVVDFLFSVWLKWIRPLIGNCSLLDYYCE